jgi:hypothetical protein
MPGWLLAPIAVAAFAAIRPAMDPLRLNAWRAAARVEKGRESQISATCRHGRPLYAIPAHRYDRVYGAAVRVDHQIVSQINAIYLGTVLQPMYLLHSFRNNRYPS